MGEGSADSGQVGVEALASWIRGFADSVTEHQAELTTLDSAIGDADHGSNMARGMAAAAAAIADSEGSDPGALLKTVGMTLVSKVGGASGPLYGTFFLRTAGAIGAGPTVGPAELSAALRAGYEGLVARGKAEPGDKTMLDALSPALDALDRELAGGASISAALRAASAAADEGRDATTPMQARKGRASYLGERSIGHQDPGATSTALLIAALAAALA